MQDELKTKGNNELWNTAAAKERNAPNVEDYEEL